MSPVAGFSSPKFRLLHLLRALGLLRVADHTKFVFSQARVRAGNRRDRKSTRLNSSHLRLSRMPSSA